MRRVYSNSDALNCLHLPIPVNMASSWHSRLVSSRHPDLSMWKVSGSTSLFKDAVTFAEATLPPYSRRLALRLTSNSTPCVLIIPRGNGKCQSNVRGETFAGIL